MQAVPERGKNAGYPQRRLRLGDHQQVAEFTLADRTNLTHEVLIGRNILRDVMLIDVGKEYATDLPASYRDNASNGDDE